MTTTNSNVSSLQQLILTPTQQPRSSTSNVFQALAQAWSQTLDNKAQEVADKANELNQDGNDTPGKVTLLSAAASELAFTANSAQNSISQYAESLKAVSKG